MKAITNPQLKTAKKVMGGMGQWLNNEDKDKLRSALWRLELYDLTAVSSSGTIVHCVFSAKDNLDFLSAYWENWWGGFETDEDAEESFIENFGAPFVEIKFLHAGIPLGKNAGDVLSGLSLTSKEVYIDRGDFLNLSAEMEAPCAGEYSFFNNVTLRGLITYRFERG